MGEKRGNEHAQMSKEEYEAFASYLESQTPRLTEQEDEMKFIGNLPFSEKKENKKEDETLACLLTEDVMVNVFALLGPQGTAKCSRTCQSWKRAAYRSKPLWRHFCQQTFGFSEGKATANWRMIYAYLSQRAQEPAQLLHDVKVVFADDGGAFQSPWGDYGSQNVVKNNHRVWCTSRDVKENVDLVVQTNIPTLVSGFALRNGGYGYTAPLQEALVFCSYQPIDLEQAKIFDRDAEGRTWIDRLEGPSEDILREEVHNDEVEDIWHASQSQGFLSPSFSLPPYPPQHDGLSRTIESKTKKNQRGQKRLRPLAAFRTEPLPMAYDASLERRIPPTVAKHVHFKLLSAHHDPNRDSANIDVKDLWTYGIPLPELAKLAQIDGSATSLPNYQRRHGLPREAL